MNESTVAARSASGPVDGPCNARGEDIPSLVTLANQVFRPAPRPGDMGREFPVLLSPRNADNLLIFREAGKVVSHVGVLRQTIHTRGVDLPVACIGAVCTDPEHRKTGLAGQLMDMAIRRSIEAGDILMPISGKRTLYVSRGATSLGPQVRFRVPISPSLPGGSDFAICPYESAGWARLAALQAREPIRYNWTDREPLILKAIRQFGGVCLLASRTGGELAAALLFCVNHPMYGGQDGFGRVVQFLGDARAIPALLAYAASRLELKGMDWTVLSTASPSVAQLLADLGGVGKTQITNWTVVILNLVKLVEKIAPAAAQAGVELSAKRSVLTVAAEGKSVALAARDLQVELLFRGPGTWSAPLAEMPQELRIACGGVLPVPLPDYGINYV